MEFNRNEIEKIEKWIEANRDSYIKDLASLISIKSVSKDGEDGYTYGLGCHEVLKQAEKIASTYGFKSRNEDDKYLLLEYGSSNGKRIGVFNHLDVVPEGMGWEHDPYTLTLKDGFVIGRGVADNKGAALSSLYAFRYLKENNIRLKSPLLLFYGVAEETGMSDIKAFTERNEAPYFSLVPDSDFPVCHGEKGNMRFTLTFKNNSAIAWCKAGEVINAIPSYAEAGIKGKYEINDDKVSYAYKDGITVLKANGIAGHAAFPEGTDNAVRNLFKAILSIEQLDEKTKELAFRIFSCVEFDYGEGLGIARSDDASGSLTAMGTILEGDLNTISISFDTRTPVTAETQEIDSILRSYAERNDIEYLLASSSEPSYTPAQNEIVLLLTEIANFIYSRDMKPYTMGGGTYCRNLPFALGFGPGLKDAPNLYPSGKGRGHQSDECILLSLLLNDIKATVLALTSLDKKLNQEE